ncbi:NAD-dependent epimerase/dehydratase family protein [Tamlana sp. 2_MG-2023]|uniref:NAD-dependent epimerase/dehydratase family protein n=1 Tax=unclassified Tamlana TaxID=2614803 RepID=UPI0026E41374|nr:MULTISPECIES: NAD-dependent epimerase/dehydratase family protein [unclassified Tamlana]MDO6760632.1 NAD-dependent epimerase/dehydratase family protein [Tamlana sp. 2_MG-2023]MDO6790888.1 NAD-dependent epimerase/dehydratase family protein [Tamlana sp. 1_MG-2023]
MILVTGGTGLVGAHLLYRLVSEKNKVRAIYRTEEKQAHTKNVFSLYSEHYEALFHSIEWIQADILDIPTMTEVFKDITQVYHCAALVSFDPNKHQLLRQVNIEGTANLVNLSLSNTIEKFCYVSSVATLGSTLNHAPITEETIWNPEDDNNDYAITKYGAEMEVWRGTQEGLDAVIVNPGVILGAGFWDSGSGKLFQKAKKGFKFYPAGTVALVDVQDVVSIMVELVNSSIKNERFILVSENLKYETFLRSLAKAVNSEPPKILATKSLLSIAWRLDWIKNKLTGKERQLTKNLSKSLDSITDYRNDKIKTALNYKFKAVDQSIVEIGTIYLK